MLLLALNQNSTVYSNSFSLDFEFQSSCMAEKGCVQNKENELEGDCGGM